MKQNPMFLLICSVCLLQVSCTWDDMGIDITDHKWEVVSILDAGNNSSEKPENSYFLIFAGGSSYELTLDANRCYGQYDISERRKINFSNAACTKICCDTEFAIRFASSISDMTHYYLRGNYLILAGDGEIKLQKAD